MDSSIVVDVWSATYLDTGGSLVVKQNAQHLVLDKHV